jgi:uncharacterized protein (TIGR00255 family)
MIRSMTAFARAQRADDQHTLTVEMRSVNNRYLDVSPRLPRAWAGIEERIRPLLQARGVSRGKVDITVSVETRAAADPSAAVNDEAVLAYLQTLYYLRDKYGLADDISVMRVASNPAVFQKEQGELDLDEVWAKLSPVLTEAVDAFVEAREREGARLREDLLGKLENIRVLIRDVDRISAEDVSAYRQKLEERIRTILADNRITVDENRILTECALHADKIAVDEELVRLRTHFGSMEQIFASDEAVGRKLDFLLQEMNREINTTGSKCNDASIARLVVDAKCILEKIREQIQNLE